MKYNLLGNTGLLVSELCLGTMTFGGKDPMSAAMGAIDYETAERLVHEALGAGINFFDTANVYGGGESEEMLGRSLKGKRHEVVIATKSGFRMGPGPNQVGLSRVHIMQQVEESLKRLGTDYIDLYQIHRPDPLTDWEEILRTLDELVHSGKVRYTGCSNLQGWQIMKANGISRQLGMHSFKSSQSYYSLAGRDVERDIIPVLQDQKMGLLVWSPMAGGFLSGKYTRENQGGAEDRRSKFDFPPVDREKGYDIIDVLQGIAAARETTAARIALAWLLNQPAVTSVIIGAKRSDQLQDNLGASGMVLSGDELSRLEEISRLKPEYPLWNPLAYTEDRYPGTV
ncbi:aldo/keto reductase [Paenibacillus terreus]|uniref:Aldo/keto reductase n=1 Tax=Paenibacillus terreus TaxID=1387834 RepID=A0ABV5BCS7_9BACL